MITIVGSGPAGSHLAYLLAKAGKKVRILEEDREVGIPIQCTGIVTSSILDHIKIPEELILTRLTKAKIIVPSGKSLTFNLKKPDLILHRENFDKYLAKKAVEAGAELLLETRFIKNEEKKIFVKKRNGEEYSFETDFLIGADGPNSAVARANDLLKPKQRTFVSGAQSQSRMDFEKDTFEVWLGYGSFAWVVPEGKETARIGLVAYKNVKEEFERLMNDRAKNTISLSYQGGLIPLYDPKQILEKNNFVYLLGDAATHVKAPSFGGIIQGLIGAESLAEAILEGKEYTSLINKKLRKDLLHSLWIRKIMDKFSKEDYDDLLNLVTKKKIKEIIETYERDHPSRFLWKIIIREPRLLKFFIKIF